MNAIAWSIFASSLVIADAMTPNKTNGAQAVMAIFFLSSVAMLIWCTVSP